MDTISHYCTCERKLPTTTANSVKVKCSNEKCGLVKFAGKKGDLNSLGSANPESGLS